VNRGRREALRAVVAALLVAVSFCAAPRTSVAGASVPAGASRYVPLATPLRLADTRPLSGIGGFSVVGPATLRIPVVGQAGVPADATAAIVRVTIIGSGSAGYLTVFPAGTTPPVAASVNSDAAFRTVANLAHVKLGVGGAIDLYRGVMSEVSVDLVGVYVPVTDAASAGRLVTLPDGSRRAFDTRITPPALGTNGALSVDLGTVGLPAGASAAVVTLTAVAAPVGDWTVYRAGAPAPPASTLVLDRASQTRAVQAVVALDGGTRVMVAADAGGNFVLDLVGWYTGDGDPAGTDGLFIPSDPKRRFDSRKLTYLAPWPRSTYEMNVDAPIAGVSAVVMNLAVLQPWDNGFFTAYPAGSARPNTSALNTSAWPQTIAGHVVARISTRGMALYTSAGAHMVVDVTGYFTGTPAAPTSAPLPLPNYDPTKAIAVSVPKLGVFLPIAASRTTAGLTTLADRGYAAAWTTNVLTPVAGNIMLFGHRTSGSAPFRNLNGLKFGDLITLIGTDGHQYHYKAVQTAVTSPLFASVNAVAGKYPPITVQLVACSKKDGTPTSLSYRISVTARLVGVT